MWSRAGDQVRRVRWISAAIRALPVSTSNRPSSVLTADTLANEGTKATPSATSASPVEGSERVELVVETSPRHSRSAMASTSWASGTVGPLSTRESSSSLVARSSRHGWPGRASGV